MYNKLNEISKYYFNSLEQKYLDTLSSLFANDIVLFDLIVKEVFSKNTDKNL